jgi:predicted nucleic acid-binding Zn ribbon protein
MAKFKNHRIYASSLNSKIEMAMKCKYCGKNISAKNAIFCSTKCHTYYSTELERKDMSNYSRVTITLDKEMTKNLREIQSKLIKNTNEGISFSQVVNLVLEEGVKIKKTILNDA